MTTDLLTQNQLLHDEIRRRIEQISAINTVAATVGYSLDLNATFDTALTAVTQVVGAEAAGISLIDEEAQEVVLQAQLGWAQDFVRNTPMRIPLGSGMSGECISEDKVIFRNHLRDDEQFAYQRFSEENFRSIVMAPMHARGRIIGILSVMSYKPHSFDEGLISVLAAIADTVAVAIENAMLHEKHVENENRLIAILQSTGDGIIATDQNSRIRLVNTTAAQMLDVRAADLIGVPLREADIQVRVRDKLLMALAPDAEEKTKSFRVFLETERELSVLVSPVHIESQVNSDDSKMDGWVIVLQDITHLREAEIARVQFIQAAAHDMKNPLSVTQSSIQMLESMVSERDDNISEVINIARTSMSRLQRLIDDLLQIEKYESGYGFRLDDVDVRELIYEISAQIKPLMQQKDITLQIEISEDTPTMLAADREWISRALYNYLENAAKYAQPHGAVLFRTFPDAGRLRFEVNDNGPGIPRPSQLRLFDRFYRVRERQDVRGSGLGLAIVKSVAEAHDGEVYVESLEGKGSCFGMIIPLRANG